MKFRYPFFYEIHWYALARYVEALLGRNHIRGSDSSKPLPVAHVAEDTPSHSKTNGNGVKSENGIKEEEDVDIGDENDGFPRNMKVEDQDEMSDAILKSLASGQTMDLDTSDDKDPFQEDSKENVKVELVVKEEVAEPPSTSGVKEHVHLCWAEMEGLINLVEFLENMPKSKRSVPDLIDNPDKLLQDARVSVLLNLLLYQVLQ